MNFSDVLKRANIYTLETFLLEGYEPPPRENKKSFSERLRIAEDQISAFFNARFESIEEHDEVSSYFYGLVEEYKNVYFEIGLITGAKIAFQLNRKIEELL